MAKPTAASLHKIKDIAIGKPSWGGVIGALLTALAGISLLSLQLGLGLVHLSYDLPFALRPTIVTDEVVMLYMDDDSHRELSQPYNAPWDRALHARLLDRLKAEGARAVVFDIVFSDPGPNPETDQDFARAIRENGKVILAVDTVPSAYGNALVNAKQYVPPHESFSAAAADLGSAEMNPDDDLIPRLHLPSLVDDPVLSEAWVTARLVGAEVTKIPKNSQRERWRNYYGPAATLTNYSFFLALQTNRSLPTGAFSNKVVFVGARLLTKFGGQRKDEFPTPHSRWTKNATFMPGVEIHATQFLNLLRGDWLNRLPHSVELAGLGVIGLIVGFTLARFRAWTVTCLGLGLLVATAVIAYLSFAHLSLWFPWVIIVVQILVALAWSLVFNSVQLYVENKMYRATIALYLSPKLVQKFATDKAWLLPGAKKQTLTVLFSDIASFTSISEGMDSDDLAKHMNSYFQTAVSKCIHHTDGTIVKYIGDAIFAFWNAPDPQDDHPLRACEAALRFRDQPPQYMNGQLLITRIGLHTGVANVGNFGSTARVDYTALGENINLASRMEGLNKYLGTIVLLTGETHAGVVERVVTRYVGSFRLKGFDRNVEVHELVDLPDKAERSRALREAFAKAVALFKQKQFGEAQAAFQRILETAPNDGPSKFYLKHLEELHAHPVPADWEGEIELKEK